MKVAIFRQRFWDNRRKFAYDALPSIKLSPVKEL
jgi:hypothetical protein